MSRILRQVLVVAVTMPGILVGIVSALLWIGYRAGRESATAWIIKGVSK